MPAIPVPYSTEVMSGLEYAFGTMLMQSDRVKEGVQIYKAVRDRFRGHNRNPWNEFECGSHYARAMSSYSALLALSGFSFDMTQKRIGFFPKIMRHGRFECF